MIKNVYWPTCKVPAFLYGCNETWIFLTDTQISNFMKIRLVRAELFHADGRRDGQMDRQTRRR